MKILFITFGLMLCFSIGAGRAQERTAEAKTAIGKAADTGTLIAKQYQSRALPDLPHGLTSFGAAVAGQHLYIYGGHTGDAHDYWNESQSPTLWRLDLNKPEQWQKLGDGPRLQGLALVSHAGKIYRLGGFFAKNAKGSEQDLWSSNEFARLNEQTGKWDLLTPLPESRSSFDAAVADGKIYVVGGWALQGADKRTWHETAWSLDLNQPSATWQPLPKPPFTRRALAVAAVNDKLYAIGGMRNLRDGASTEVDVLDLKSGKWSKGPALPGEGMQGFGSSAFAMNNALYATTMSGQVCRLSTGQAAWEEAGKLARPRFFHRLVPADKDHLIVVGGAHMGSGKILSQEVISAQP